MKVFEDKKILQKLNALSTAHIKKFDLFINSPYFNKNKDVVFVYEISKKYLNLKKNSSFNEYIVKAFLKQKRKISSSSINKYSTKVVNLIDQFIVLEGILDDTTNLKVRLGKYYLNNNKQAEFNKTIKEISQQIDQKKLSPQKYLKLLELEELKWFYESRTKDNRKDDCNIFNKNKALDRYYLAEKMFTVSEMIIRAKLTNKSIDLNHIKNLLKTVLEKNDLENDILLRILFTAINLQTVERNDKLSLFNELLKDLNDNGQALDDHHLKNLNVIIMNQAKFVCKDREELYKFMFQFYKQCMENKSIYHEGRISHLLVNNIVTAGIKLSQFDWLLNFLEAHKEIIFPINLQQDMYQYSLVRVYLFSKDLKMALNQIDNYKFKDVYHQLSAKQLKLLLYFELEEWLLLASLIKAFRMSLTPKRSKGISEMKLLFERNFINYFNKLYTFKINPDKDKIAVEKIIVELKQKKEVSEKSWLLERLAGL